MTGEKSQDYDFLQIFLFVALHPCSVWPPPGRGSSAPRWGPTWGWSEAGDENMLFRKIVYFFVFITGPCEQERLKVQYTAHRTFSIADSLTVGLTPRWDFSACCWEMKGMPSIRCLHDLDTFPGFFFSPEVLGHQQIVGYQIPPFWLIG